MTQTPGQLFTPLEEFITELNPENVSEERKAVLQPLIDFIQTNVAHQKDIRLTFICTHNSRRSHLAQVWAQTMAHYFAINNLLCYSGGTEATALFPAVAETLQNAGFQLKTISKNENPVYCIKYADNEHPIIGFSKISDDDFNPKSGFAAIMTCDTANEACPFVAGAALRIPITFEDPKVYDNSPQQGDKYKERSMQIATEMFYVFSQMTP